MSMRLPLSTIVMRRVLAAGVLCTAALASAQPAAPPAKGPVADTPRPAPPVPSPLTACAGKTAGSACGFTDAQGRAVRGTCAGPAPKPGTPAAVPQLACVAAPAR